MYKTVYDLTPEQFDELRTAFFWSDEPEALEILEQSGITAPEEIPNDVIFHHYEGVCFVDDDFSCTAWDGSGTLPHALPF